tara:strand:+ start:382 stop:558 length:177 start_codon:yes stop_codon:yes gene_type:complete
MDNDQINVGDEIGFKDGYEQYGRVVKINGSTLIVSVFNSDTGDRDEFPMDARRTWLEG